DFLPYSEFGVGLLHFDPFDTACITEAIRQIVASAERRQEISRLLLSNPTPRSWKDYGIGLLDCYRQLAGDVLEARHSLAKTNSRNAKAQQNDLTMTTASSLSSLTYRGFLGKL